MTSYTSKAAGAWNSAGATTWNEAGYPIAGDTVSITHAVTSTSGQASACATLGVSGTGTLTIYNSSLGLTVSSTYTHSSSGTSVFGKASTFGAISISNGGINTQVSCICGAYIATGGNLTVTGGTFTTTGMTLSATATAATSTTGIIETGTLTKSGTGAVNIGGTVGGNMFTSISWNGGTLTFNNTGAENVITTSVIVYSGTVVFSAATSVGTQLRNDGGVLTITVNTVACTGFVLNAGTTNLNGNLTFYDGSGCGFTIAAGVTAFYNNGTAAAPRYMQSESTNPAYPWTLTIYDVVGYDSRILDFDYLILYQNYWSLGNDTNYIYFNGHNTNNAAYGFIGNITPLVREPKIDNHFIEGRPYSRVYHNGTWAGTVVISGSLTWAGENYNALLNIIASGQRISFISTYVCLPKCRIESPRFNPKSGSPYVDFTITLIEDA